METQTHEYGVGCGGEGCGAGKCVLGERGRLKTLINYIIFTFMFSFFVLCLMPSHPSFTSMPHSLLSCLYSFSCL